ncbi:MAG: TIGR01212 family radical SAM protein [Christensenellales bacterium]
MYKYNGLSENLISVFGEKVYKISLDGGMTCPNRDGKLSYGGCIFCSGGGSGEFAEPFSGDVYAQIECAKEKVKNKAKNKFIAYFQNFSNTYGDPRYLKRIFTAAISHPDVVALSVATRPDCLGCEILNLLKDLNKIKPVYVELGLQTIHDKTAKFINRCYNLDVYVKAVEELKKIGITVVTHLILGLPGETEQMVLESVRFVGKLTDGIKLQNLQVLKGTELERLYNLGQVDLLEKEEYIDLLCKCVRLLPPEVVIHRLTGDPPKRILVAPLWCANKKDTLNSIHRAFSLQNVVQGDKLNKTN